MAETYRQYECNMINNSNANVYIVMYNKRRCCLFRPTIKYISVGISVYQSAPSAKVLLNCVTHFCFYYL